MNTYVIIFRLKPGQLSEDDIARRAEETRVWAQRVNAAGHKLEPRILGPQSLAMHPGGEPQPAADSEPVTALLFLEAADLAAAAEVAREHPGRRFGASVEIRPWSPPPTPQPQPGP